MSASPITGIDIHVYLIKDVERAVAFWRDAVGLPVACLYDGEGAEFELGDGAVFGIWKPQGEMPWQAGNGIMFAVPDLKRAMAEMRSRGVTIGPHIHESPICRMAFAEDSEGNSFILHQRR